jgi:hypothetical protein
MAGWLSCHSGRVILFQCKLKRLALARYQRSHGGRRKCRARKRARRRRVDLGLGLGRGAMGGTKNIDPKSAPSTASPAVVLEPAKNFDVASLWLALPLSSSVFLSRRATAMNRETRLGRIAAAMLRAKRDTAVAACGTRLAICFISRPGFDCRKREPVSVRGRHAPARRAGVSGPRCGGVHIRAQARWPAARRQYGDQGLCHARPASRPAPAPAA